jgi:uracil-DNA glycosylase
VDAFFFSPSGQQLLDYLQRRLDAGAVVFPPQPLRAG